MLSDLQVGAIVHFPQQSILCQCTRTSLPPFTLLLGPYLPRSLPRHRPVLVHVGGHRLVAEHVPHPVARDDEELIQRTTGVDVHVGEGDDLGGGREGGKEGGKGGCVVKR
ncbi:hypothetical protein Naga_101144g1 [Nannochloropsis gaditana]|uniref:Uncharacterized protein n=1 Tax=Nannochloropsis gaditana TaxID=72520 RepID=W7U1L0_9STRA|nr:hypothetical protein Naga_101144g1 [Nannochloropsis gaditana]